jgi:hypothetical protein
MDFEHHPNDENQNDGLNEFLICTICDQNLNNPVYKICSHDILKVPLCILCFESQAASINNEEFLCEEDAQKCTWCTESGDLFVCGDGESCSHLFCVDCIESRLGNDKLIEIQGQENWKCLVCDNTDILPYQQAFQWGIKQSIYFNSNITKLLSNLSDNDESNGDSDNCKSKNELESQELDMNIENNIFNQIISESNLATVMLEDDKLDEVKREIVEELESSGCSDM